MTELFSLLGEFIKTLVCWVPRLGICRATHGGVKFIRGWKVKRIWPGMFWYLPITTEIEVIPTARQSINLPAQTLVTKDGRSVFISTVLTCEITDPLKAVGHAWDTTDTIMDLGASAALQIVTGRTFAELRDNLAGEVCEELVKEAQKLLRPYGVKILQGRLSDFAECRVFRLIGDGAASYG